MCRSLAPVKVSPVIKTARWGFLILGVLYGYTKHQSLKAYEKVAGPRREEEIRRNHEQRKLKDLNFTAGEISMLANEFEFEELPQGWQKEL